MHHSGARIVLAVVAATIVLAGCARGFTQHREDSRGAQLQAWLLERCPSEPSASPPENYKAMTGVFESLLIAGGIDYLFGRVKKALLDAAEEDRNGRATSGTNPAYLWWNTKVKTSDSEMVPVRRPAGCLVVALTESPPTSWCDAGNHFKAPVPSSLSEKAENLCGNVGRLVKESDGDPPAPSLQPSLTGSGVPEFYAEIKLSPARDTAGIYPQLQLLYYPEGIHGEKFKTGKPRDVVITISGTTPGGENALTPIVLQLVGIQPDSALVDPGALTIATAVWTAASAIPEGYPIPDSMGPFYPVNLSSSIREVGAKNIFLQAFAAIFASQSEALATAAKERLVSEPTSPEELLSAYDAAAAAVWDAQGALTTACQGGLQQMAAVNSQYLLLLEAHRSLDKLEKPVPPLSFKPDFHDIAGRRGKTREEICQGL